MLSNRFRNEQPENYTLLNDIIISELFMHRSHKHILKKQTEHAYYGRKTLVNKQYQVFFQEE